MTNTMVVPLPGVQEDELRQWVRQHEVCGEVAAYFEVLNHRKVQVGFSLTLLAMAPPGCTLNPACESCMVVYEGLGSIASHVVPKGARVHIEPFDSSFHMRPETQWEPEVELVAEVLHREGTFEPPDEIERAYPAEIRRKLDALGVEARAWKTRRGPTRRA